MVDVNTVVNKYIYEKVDIQDEMNRGSAFAGNTVLTCSYFEAWDFSINYFRHVELCRSPQSQCPRKTSTTGSTNILRRG